MHNSVLFKTAGRNSAKPYVILQPKRQELNLSRLGNVTLGSIAKVLFSADACLMAFCAAVALMWVRVAIDASAVATLKPLLYASPWLLVGICKSWREAMELAKKGGKA